MTGPCYIGDEATAAGFRLAGVRVRAVQDGEEAAAFATAPGDARLLLVSSSVAAGVRAAALDAALAALAPLMVIVPDLRGETPPPDLAARLRRELGLEESP
jgi:vacuolar-type H+-ATPase subunit F/Vma7